ncbi:hypothetical protein FRC02_003101 [Tulasnella sp. 418]|nr:hypothetical protein FRC02_003101 [Tulasnella sp. 418]
MMSHIRQRLRCTWALKKLQNTDPNTSDPEFDGDPEDIDKSAEDSGQSDGSSSSSSEDSSSSSQESGSSESDEEETECSSEDDLQERVDSALVDEVPEEVSQSMSFTSSKKSRAQRDADLPPIAVDVFEGAGKVLEQTQSVFEAWEARQQGGNPYYPFKSKLDYEVGMWAKQEGPGNKALDKLLAFPAIAQKLDLSFKNTCQLNQIIDYQTPEVPSWLSLKIKLDGSNEEFDVYYHDPLECIKALFSNPEFADKMTFAPERHWVNSRIYNEMHTGDWWWRKQCEVKKPGATIVPIIVGTDKSQLTTFSGNLEAYPGYLTIGNIHKRFRRKISQNAQMLFVLLPTGQFKGKGMSDKDQRLAKARIFHCALKEVFKSLEVAGTNGVRLTTGDGKVRLCFPILACYVADYPEQCLVTCTRFMDCPICPCKKARLGEYGDIGKPRTQAQTMHILNTAQTKGPSWAAIDEYFQQYGVTATFDPFWRDLPHTNIHLAIMPDILHQLHQGMIKHLTIWISRLIGPKELDQRLQRMPPNHSLRVYSSGISGFSKLMGNEHRQLSKQLLGCIADYPASVVVNATRVLCDFLEIAQYPSQSSDTLGYLEETIQELHKYKDIFIRLGAREGGFTPVISDYNKLIKCWLVVKNFNLPKLHMMLHYDKAIRLFGTTDGYNTVTTERMHIEAVKIPYRASNRCNVIPQIMVWMERKDRVDRLALLVKRSVHQAEMQNQPSQKPNTTDGQRMIC